MKHSRMHLAACFGAVLCAGALLWTQAASAAAKPGNVGKLPGKAYIIRVSPDGKWLASWSEMAKDKYTLFVVNLEKGDRKEVVQVADPGGLCWIPGKGQLLYAKGNAKTSPVKHTAVTYMVYDVSNGESTRVGEVADLVKNYTMDPIASEDGSMAFHMTLSLRTQPSFNIYFVGDGVVKSLESYANIAGDYDISSDGTALAWFLTDEATKSFNIVTWDLEFAKYTGLFEYSNSMDPAEGHLLFRLDMPHKQAATLAISQSDPTLNACVYNFANPDKLSVVPVNLKADEEALSLDWKGRSGILYMLVSNKKTKEFSIQEYDPATRKATVLLTTKDPISETLEYAPGAQAYFYSIVTEGKKPETTLVRVSLK